MFTFLYVVRIFHSTTIKGFFAQILVVALLYKNLLMLLAVRIRVMDAPKKFGELSKSCSYPRLRLELLLHIFRTLQTSRTITRCTHAQHEQILKFFIKFILFVEPDLQLGSKVFIFFQNLPGFLVFEEAV